MKYINSFSSNYSDKVKVPLPFSSLDINNEAITNSRNVQHKRVFIKAASVEIGKKNWLTNREPIRTIGMRSRRKLKQKRTIVQTSLRPKYVYFTFTYTPLFIKPKKFPYVHCWALLFYAMQSLCTDGCYTNWGGVILAFIYVRVDTRIVIIVPIVTNMFI